eukprot:1140284-Pelagomonas_calceolata.AAC.3
MEEALQATPSGYNLRELQPERSADQSVTGPLQKKPKVMGVVMCCTQGSGDLQPDCSADRPVTGPRQEDMGLILILMQAASIG